MVFAEAVTVRKLSLLRMCGCCSCCNRAKHWATAALGWELCMFAAARASQESSQCHVAHQQQSKQQQHTVLQHLLPAQASQANQSLHKLWSLNAMHIGGQNCTIRMSGHAQLSSTCNAPLSCPCTQLNGRKESIGFSFDGTSVSSASPGAAAVQQALLLLPAARPHCCCRLPWLLQPPPLLLGWAAPCVLQ